jgi:DNA-binding response OmpR family regulator
MPVWVARRNIPSQSRHIAATGQAQRVRMPSTATELQHGVRVLLVDDDDANRDAMARALARAGFDVLAAVDGTEALEFARDQEPDVVVLDLLLPDAGGLGVAREVRREHPSHAIPILFITGLPSPAVRDALSPAPVLFKPFTGKDLVRRVRELARER